MAVFKISKHLPRRQANQGRHKQYGILSQRTWGIVLVLCCLLAVPFWWAKKANQKTAAELAVVNGSAQSATAAEKLAMGGAETTGGAAVQTMGSAPGSANPSRHGLSFGLLAPPGLPAGTVASACSGAPLEMGNPDKGQCNPYQGDTMCRTALPVLCILKDGSTAESVGLANDPKAEGGSAGFSFYAGWAGGTLGTTAPVAGFVLGSLAQANARCTAELGAGWRMAEFHDAGGGWGLVGKRGAGWPEGQSSPQTRHWVYINDQKANCWDEEVK